MSKIHEALKKAQQERSLGLTGDDASLRSTVSAAPIVSNEFISPTVRRATAESAEFDCRLVSSVIQEYVSDSPSSSTKNLEPLPPFEELLEICAKSEWSPDTNALVFSPAHPHGIGAEQFRTLRSRLYSVRETAPLKKILITSAIPGEGKTFVASNIAQAFACEKDRRVLLIDGDLRKPRLHTVLGAPLAPGVSECLRGEIELAKVIQHGQKGNLCFIPGGEESAHASELLSNGRMQKLLDRVTPLFDWIIIDSPPCLPVADAGVLAGMCDGVLLVVRATHTPLAMAQKARKELQRRNVVGVVLNAVEKQGVYESYHSYGYGYGQARPAPANKF